VPRIVFEANDGIIKLMWRGQRGNRWPPQQLANMFSQLRARGVPVSDEAWAYLHRAREGLSFVISRTFAAVVISMLLAPAAIVVFIGLVTRPHATLVGLAFLLAVSASYVVFGVVFWLVERGYHDLPTS
jgi:hypothetical protein